MSRYPEIDRAIAALVAICERHTVNGRATADPDCGDCGSRQEATRIYLLSMIEDCERALFDTERTAP